MIQNWSEYLLEDLMATPSINGIHKGVEYQGHGVPIVKMGEVYNSTYIGNRVRDKFELTPREISRFSLQENDLLFCRTSLVRSGIGKCAIVRELVTPTAFASNLIRIRINPVKADAKLLFYFFQSHEGRELLRSVARGTSVTTITGPDISSFRVKLPELSEQHAVVKVLESFDKLMEINTSQMGALQEIVKVSYKAATNENASQILFGEIAELSSERQHPNINAPEEVYLGLEHFGEAGLGLLSQGSTREVTSLKSSFRKGDVLYGKLRPYFRKVARPNFSGLCSTEIWVIRPKKGFYPGYVEWITSSEEFTNFAMGGSAGTKMPRASWSHVSKFSIPRLSRDAQEELEVITNPLWEQYWTLREENSQLAKTRDELLPLLLSGAIRVKDIAA